MTVEEFQTSLKNVCQGKDYDDLPSSFKQWIVAMFNTIDTDGKVDRNKKYVDLSFYKATASLVWRSSGTTVSTDRRCQTSRSWTRLSVRSLRTAGSQGTLPAPNSENILFYFPV